MAWLWLWRLAPYAGFAVLLALTTLIVGGAYDARRRLPELKPWHRVKLDDVDASTLDDSFGLPQYLAREERLFAQVRELEATIDAADRTPVNRYHPGSLSHPSSAGRDWNRSFESEPATIRGGALLIHGLTDSPYSMRAVADVLREQGIYSLALRLPGHGTLPSGLVDATWQDWLAAVRMGARHVASRIPGDAPFVVVGYSNGGALALKYALDAVEGNGNRVPSKLILLSPMIGVSASARLAWWVSLLGNVPYFEKARWLDVLPEYNPFKYNSFSANAAFQTTSLTRTVQADIARVGAGSRRSAIPPILAFQSIVDATVSTPAVVHALYDLLPSNGSELVLFDVNHLSGIDAFVQPGVLSLAANLLEGEPRDYGRVVVTNATGSSREVEARAIEAGSVALVRRPLGLAWPPEVFSLTHVALPFAANDPLYGIEGPADFSRLLPIGRLSPRGEREVLIVGTDTLMRLSSNPFFPFIAEHIEHWLNVRGDSRSTEQP